jgi:putative transposase
MDVTAACDFFVVPTATFKLLYVFGVLSHARRRIVHINVADHPTAAWTARQILGASARDTLLRIAVD